MVSIKDVAERCGVSIATVSKALNNHNDVSENTKRLIKQTADELGYLPNSQARALKTNRTYSIGVIYADKSGTGIAHAYFSQVLESFRAEAERLGYDITFINNRNIGDRSMSYLEHCKYRNVDGVAIVCADFYDSNVTAIINSDIPLVTIDFISEKTYSVSSDNAMGIKRLVEYVVSQGHRNIAYIYGDSSQVTTNRLDSFKATLESLNIKSNVDYVRQSKYHDPISASKITKEMLSLYNPPTCIIAPDDYSAIGVMNAIRQLGLSVPNDVSVIGYDGTYLSQIFERPLTTIRQNIQLIGERSAQMLIKLINKQSISEKERHLIVGGELLTGETVKTIK
ncbi:MAG: LacI family transcriptional regulator [Ruminococcus sp.]|nr:LacI family transcriptional regulator [Ruminococcus sp.]MCD7800391.1 LacI family transcriptional regulator [Ruminococcus sp.]